MNWYAYCGNNPLNCVDPMGLVKIPLLTIWNDPILDLAERFSLKREVKKLRKELRAREEETKTVAAIEADKDTFS